MREIQDIKTNFVVTNAIKHEEGTSVKHAYTIYVLINRELKDYKIKNNDNNRFYIDIGQKLFHDTSAKLIEHYSKSVIEGRVKLTIDNVYDVLPP